MIHDKMYKGFMLDPVVIHHMEINTFVDRMMINVLQMYCGILDDVTPILGLKQEVIYSFLEYKYNDFIYNSICPQYIIDDDILFWEKFEILLFKTTRNNMTHYTSELIGFVIVLYNNRLNEHNFFQDELLNINNDYEDGINIYDENYKNYSMLVLYSSLKYWFLKNTINCQLKYGSAGCLK